MAIALLAALGCRAGETDAIAWFEGSVDAAFAAARASDRPVFLYWGAVWCPPCNALKSTVFRDPAFIATTRLFVPVYIDGDAPAAQALQDRFATQGYPTLIVFDPAGRELIRIPGGTDVARYAEVLELALEHIAPVADILTAYLDRGQAIGDTGWRLLANHAWSQDAGRALGQRDARAVLRRLADAVPAELGVERTLLQREYLRALARDGTADDAVVREDALARVHALLADAGADGDFLAWELGELIAQLSDEGSDARARVIGAWRDWIARTLPVASGSQRLALLYAQTDTLRLAGEQVDPGLRARAVREVDALSGAASDLQGRSVLLHDAAALLAHVGEEDRAMALLREAIDSGGFDYYWMADLAGIAERLGRVDEALAWRERAWHAARGPATRVQWGARWLDALLRLRPQDDVAITATVEALFDELGKQPAALSGRNRSALTAIATPLGDWAAGGARAGVLARARDRLAALCRRDYAADAAEFARCTVILGT
ncbi:MAG: Thiol:disulfide interchange protein DsbD [Pseudomonadales bacterium]|nr:Thiol:disulfide interchange protein DsbD [Pseudomonadales bacterium]